MIEGKIFTGRYQDKRLSDATHLCVRTTRGAPRFRLGYSLAHQLEPMKPPRGVLGLAEAEFTMAYRAHLDAAGRPAIERDLQQLEAQAGGRAVVLLCFCDLEAGGFCHRRIFARWLAQRGGLRIEELGAG